MSRIKVIDPGGAIGWSEVSLFKSNGFELDAWGEHRYHMVFLDALWSDLQNLQFQGVVLEDWRSRPGIRTPQPDAQHQIGAIQWMCHNTGVPLFMQTPGDVLAWITPERHKAVQRPAIELMNGEKAAGHGLMTLKHALYFAHQHPEVWE